MVEIPLWTAWCVMFLLSFGALASFVKGMASIYGPDSAAQVLASVFNVVLIVYIAMGVFA